jgi:hypothetical protein
VLLLVALSVVVGVLGGWNRTTPEGLRVADPGEDVRVTPFQVSLDRAEATYEVAGDVADEGLAYVVIEGSLSLDGPGSVERTVVGEAFAADLESTYGLFGGPEEEGAPTTVVVAEDGSELLGLGPGLTYDVLLIWEIDEVAVPSATTVTLRKHTWRGFSLDQTEGWFDAEPVVGVTLDIAPLPDERPVEEDFL